jgi:hypothetical protein
MSICTPTFGKTTGHWGKKPTTLSPPDVLNNKGVNCAGSHVVFKGKIQDFRINDHFVLRLDNQSGGEGEEQTGTTITEALPLFGQKLIVFNEFECQSGWMVILYFYMRPIN